MGLKTTTHQSHGWFAKQPTSTLRCFPKVNSLTDKRHFITLISKEFHHPRVLGVLCQKYKDQSRLLNTNHNIIHAQRHEGIIVMVSFWNVTDFFFTFSLMVCFQLIFCMLWSSSQGSFLSILKRVIFPTQLQWKRQIYMWNIWKWFLVCCCTVLSVYSYADAKLS